MEKERKHQIIRAAIKRFQKHGLKKTTLDEVARDLRIGKATIYHYFSSKEVLYFECLKFETSLFLVDINLIFNNNEIDTNKKLFEYFQLKEKIKDKYKLLFAVFIEELKGTIFDDEKELLANFISEEKTIIFNAVKSLKRKSDEEEIIELTDFIVTHSLSLLFAAQISNKEQTDNPAANVLLLTKVVEFLLQ